ncbi:MAG: hypothetical protein J6K43_05115, partial [Lachnospiraceae bacterium]|nr:hypothetical protein [Lachnospiraceae bacterium]
TGYLRGARLIARQMGEDIQYYHFNGHGDTSSITDGNGTTLRNYVYDAFGNVENLHDLDTNPFRYCGEYYDAETGFIYLRARYYAPEIGRFISEDPIRDGLNWYTYCENNPVMFVDPWGLEITLPGIISVDDERFKALQSLTDDTLNVDLETEIVSYMANESPEREISTNLVREVINDDINCEIVFTKAENGYSRPKYKNGVLVSTQIAFNPSFTFHPWTKFEGENGARRSLMPSFMILGHEMVHTVRRMQGVERDRRDNGAIYLAPPIPGKTLMQVWRPEEIETTGIDYAKVYYDEKGKIISTTRVEASKFYYSENSLRAEYDRVHKNDEGYFPLGLRCIY